MEYMESKMQDLMDAGTARAEDIWAGMKRFEDVYLSFPDADETLLEQRHGDFNYEDENVQLMWVFFRKGACLYP